MTAIHRREMLGVMLCGAVVATAGLALMPVPAESAPLTAPLTMSKSRSATTDNLVEEAVVVVRRRRRRVRVCRWHRGRRVCRRRWVWV
jgi:hypothetical protein